MQSKTFLQTLLVAQSVRRFSAKAAPASAATPAQPSIRDRFEQAYLARTE